MRRGESMVPGALDAQAIEKESKITGLVKDIRDAKTAQAAVGLLSRFNYAMKTQAERPGGTIGIAEMVEQVRAAQDEEEAKQVLRHLFPNVDVEGAQSLNT